MHSSKSEKTLWRPLGTFGTVDDIFVDLTGNERASMKLLMLFKGGITVSLF